jgi:hypothetical protein
MQVTWSRNSMSSLHAARQRSTCTYLPGLRGACDGPRNRPGVLGSWLLININSLSRDMSNSIMNRGASSARLTARLDRDSPRHPLLYWSSRNVYPFNMYLNHSRRQDVIAIQSVNKFHQKQIDLCGKLWPKQRETSSSLCAPWYRCLLHHVRSTTAMPSSEEHTEPKSTRIFIARLFTLAGHNDKLHLPCVTSHSPTTVPMNTLPRPPRMISICPKIKSSYHSNHVLYPDPAAQRIVSSGVPASSDTPIRPSPQAPKQKISHGSLPAHFASSCPRDNRAISPFPPSCDIYISHISLCRHSRLPKKRQNQIPRRMISSEKKMRMGMAAFFMLPWLILILCDSRRLTLPLPLSREERSRVRQTLHASSSSSSFHSFVSAVSNPSK